MERRLVLFAVTAFAMLAGLSGVYRVAVSATAAAAQAIAQRHEEAEGARESRNRRRSRRSPKAQKPQAAPELKAPPEPEVPEQWVTLGSADENDPYRMLVTLSNRGAAVARIELSSPRYRDIDDRSGYLGHLVMDSSRFTATGVRCSWSARARPPPRPD